MTEPLARTPLFDFHVAQGARLVPFAGWEMPVQYTGIIEEHIAVRKAAGLFDVSHMGEARVRGRDAAAFLDRIMTNEMSSIKSGSARYTIMCQPDGGCVDDLIVYRISESDFFICLNASNAKKDIAWMQSHIGTAQVEVIDECKVWAQLALQGPLAEKILSHLTDLPLAEIKRFQFLIGAVAGAPGCIVSRTGYTGSAGFEIYLPAAQATAVAQKLIEVGKPLGLLPVGLGARDSLRLEAGYPLYGHEISETISPIQAGLGWTVKLNKGEFIGRAVLQKQVEQGAASKVVHFLLNDRRIARQGTPVLSGDSIVGEVLSGTLSPILNKPIGSALVQSDAKPETLAVDIRGTRIPLQIAVAPFVK
jgi:aminomethyltransferase